MKLIDPPGFDKLTPEEIAKVSNGCGPEGFGWMVPDYYPGLDFKPA
jgi:hypothetical protein